MKIRTGILFAVAGLLGTSRAAAQSFEAATVGLPAPGSGLSCRGGPGTDSPGIWRCTNMPLALVISKAFRFKPFQFSGYDRCCLRRFDFAAKIPPRTTPEAFDRMLQDLLIQRFGLSFHYQAKEMPVYELALDSKGGKLERSAGPRLVAEQLEPWWIPPRPELDQDGYPIFMSGKSGLASGWGGRYRWVAFNITIEDIASTLSDELGQPVVDLTGLVGRYDIDLRWVNDVGWQMSERAKAEVRERGAEVPDMAAGVSLIQAVRDSLGLVLRVRKGRGEIVVIDHVSRVPTDN